MRENLRGQSRGEREGALGAVQDVEVVARRVVGEEIADLRESPVDADGLDDVGVFRGDFEAGDELARKRRAAHGGEALDLFQREHGHDAGHDGDGDAGGAAFFHEAVIDGVVEEELGGDEVGAGVDFAFKVGEVDFEGGGFGMFFGIAADAEAEARLAGFQEGDEVAGVAEAVLVESFRWEFPMGSGC